MRRMICAAALAATCALWSVQSWAQETTAPAPADAAATTTTSEAAPAEATAEPTPEELEQQARAFFESLNRRTGQISIAAGKATLTVPETHYFIGPEDSRRVLVEAWGNPPAAAENIEGMIFPADGNPAMGSWGAVVEYANEGYVSDSDAKTINYTDLLHQMQNDVRTNNTQRHAQGYPTFELIGWAEPPHYDGQSHKLYWAKDLRVEGAEVDTLNYDIRVLGREGYLQIEFVAGMPELDAIRGSIPAVLEIPEFTEGNRYADFDQSVDRRAAYGIGGLIAGGAAVAVAQKTGLIALLLAFGKKFIILIGVALAGIGKFVQRLFGGKSKGDAGDPPANTPA